MHLAVRHLRGHLQVTYLSEYGVLTIRPVIQLVQKFLPLLKLVILDFICQLSCLMEDTIALLNYFRILTYDLFNLIKLRDALRLVPPVRLLLKKVKPRMLKSFYR